MKTLLSIIIVFAICTMFFNSSVVPVQPVKNHLIQADVFYTIDQSVNAAPVPAAPAKWLDNHLFSAISGVTLIVYEFLALKLPTSKTVSIIGNLYKVITWLVPDRSKKGGCFKLK